MTTTTGKRALTALVAAGTATAYYAVPDFVPSRTARGWIKAGLLVAGGAATWPSREERVQMRTAWADAMNARTSEDAADKAGDEVGAPDGTRPFPGPAVVAAGVAVLAATTVATVAAERWLFRRGEARAAAGVRYPHTRTALVLGGISLLISLVPEPDARPSGTPDPS